VLLRGVNVAGLGDYWRKDLTLSYPTATSAFEHGACPKTDESIEPPPVCAKDFSKIASLGFNSVRLTLSWSRLEPKPGVIDQPYLRRIDQVVRWARDAGLWIVLDLHQDGWSKYAYTRGTCPPGLDPTPGYDGAPEWATDTTLPFCTVHGTRELDPGVALNFQRLWSNALGPDGVGLGDHLAHVTAVLAQRYQHDPTVVGYDLLNEPSPGTALPPAAEVQLNAYYAKAIAAMRTAAPGLRQLVFVEPDVARATVTPAPTEPVPFSAYSDYPNVVFAPHIYTGVFTADAIAGQPQRVQQTGPDWDAAVRDARALGLPMWVGEFGCGPDADDTILEPAYQELQHRGIGGAMWIWKENHNDTNPAQTWSIEGSPREVSTARGYPMLTGGQLFSLEDNPLTHRFAMIVAFAKGTTVVFLPPSETGPLHLTGARAAIRRVGAARVVALTPTAGVVTLSVG
jgi:endoglycosylceramidase